MNTTELVVEIRPEKNSGPYGIWTYDLCDTRAGMICYSGCYCYNWHWAWDK